MNDLVHRGRRALHRADDALLAVRDRMTPGQRWTATLLMTIVCAVVLYGAPTATVVGPPAAAASAPLVAAPEAPPAPASPVPFRTRVEVPATAEPLTPVAGVPGSPAPDEPVPVAAEPSPQPRVTAVLPAAGGGLPGRDERAVAEVFLAGAGFHLDATADAGAPDACDATGGASSLVLVPERVEPELLDCLRSSGASVLGFDEAGSRLGVLSSRRGRVDAMRSLARWVASDGRDGPKVGIVGGAEDRAWLDPLVPRLRLDGLDVRITAYPEPDPASVNGGVRAFAAEGVEAVVLAAPAAVRRLWSAQHAVLTPGVRFLVADVHEGVAEETHAPSFDGALALTTLRGSWYARTHGETPEQAGCRARWESGAGRMLGGESRFVFAWCQHVAAAEAALREAAAAGEGPGAALRRLRVASPLTSDLGPVSGSWGPLAEAVVVWRAACSCWAEAEPFRPMREA